MLNVIIKKAHTNTQTHTQTHAQTVRQTHKGCPEDGYRKIKIIYRNFSLFRNSVDNVKSERTVFLLTSNYVNRII